jgi:hypothetical protein
VAVKPRGGSRGTTSDATRDVRAGPASNDQDDRSQAGRGRRGPDDCVRHRGGLTAAQEWRHPADRVVLVGWCRKASCLAAVAARGPSSQALVVQVVQERGQKLSGGRQPGIKVPLELFGRLLAVRPVPWSSTLSRLLVRIWQRSWVDPVVPHRHPAAAVRVVAAPPDVEPPRRAAGR